MPIHAKSLCPGCYNYVFHADKAKEYNKRKSHDIDLKTYKRVTEKCAICGFDKIVDIHHIDKNKKNNDSKNLVGLCPNHHRLIHNYRFRNEIWAELQKQGYHLPFDEKLDFHTTSTKKG